jgi:hypothetical protein
LTRMLFVAIINTSQQRAYKLRGNRFKSYHS